VELPPDLDKKAGRSALDQGRKAVKSHHGSLDNMTVGVVRLTVHECRDC
jgi:hypothetical protein